MGLRLSHSFLPEPDLGPSDESCSEKSTSLKYISVQSSVIVILSFFNATSMQSIKVRKDLFPLAKRLSVKSRSLGKYQLCIPLAIALISQGYVKVKPDKEKDRINFLRLKRENIEVVKKINVEDSSIYEVC